MLRTGLSISFGLTADRIHQKSVTRRTWRDTHAAKFIRAFEQEKQIVALDRDRRYGGKQIGWLTLAASPYQEKLADMPDSDIPLEGYPELTRSEFIDQFFGGDSDQILWVIRFKFEEKE